VTSLAEVQTRLREAVVTGACAPAAPLLVGGLDPVKRLDIHRNHYETSLVSAILGRFPATGWLVGASSLREAASAFVRRHPPTAPCVADYGGRFPSFLAARPGTASLSYLQAFAELDWHLGRLAVSVDRAPLTRQDLATLGPDALTEAVATLQEGIYYAHAAWPLDELMQAYLADAAPERWTLVDREVWFEARGSRGEFRFSRLTAPVSMFRSAIADGRSLGDAAGLALSVDPAFDPGAALVALVDDGLVTSINLPRTGASS
jgi:hypothetical protein